MPPNESTVSRYRGRLEINERVEPTWKYQLTNDLSWFQRSGADTTTTTTTTTFSATTATSTTAAAAAAAAILLLLLLLLLLLKLGYNVVVTGDHASMILAIPAKSGLYYFYIISRKIATTTDICSFHIFSPKRMNT